MKRHILKSFLWEELEGVRGQRSHFLVLKNFKGFSEPKFLDSNTLKVL